MCDLCIHNNNNKKNNVKIISSFHTFSALDIKIALHITFSKLLRERERHPRGKDGHIQIKRI